MRYRLGFGLIMLRRQLARALGFRPEDEPAALHATIAELSLALGQITEEKLHMVKILRQGLLQLGDDHHPVQAMKHITDEQCSAQVWLG